MGGRERSLPSRGLIGGNCGHRAQKSCEYHRNVSDTLSVTTAPSCCRREHGHGSREAQICPGSAQGVRMEPRAPRAVRSSRCWWAPLRRCPPSSAWSSASGKKVRAAREPAQVARMIVARLHCTCYAPAPPPARLDLMLTTPACALSAAPVRPGGDSMRSPDEPEYTELLYERQRVGPGTSAPSRRTLAVCATMLLYLAAEDKAL